MGLIKSARTAEVRVVRASARPPQAGAAQGGAAPAVSALEQLEAKLDAQSARIAQLEADVATAQAAGETKGYKVGLAEGLARQRERVDAIGAGVTVALDDFRAALASLERLAPLIASAALEHVLGPKAPQAALLRQQLERRLKHIERAAVIAVEVSGEDFDAAAVADLNRFLGAGAPCTTSATMPAGACRIRLRLGVEEIEPLHQWTALAATLAALGAPGRAPP